MSRRSELPSIQTMTAAHVDAVMKLDLLVYPRPWTQTMWEKEVEDTDRTHMVVVDGDEVIGHAGLMYVIDEVHVTTVAVAPSRQGQGLASALVLVLLEQAVAAGAVSGTLEVRAADRRTQRLYSRFGFTPAGVRSGYYSNPADDGIIMWLVDMQLPDSLRRLEEVRSELLQVVANIDGVKS